MTSLNETSLILLNSQMGAFIVWIAFGSINFFAAILTILTLAIWKPLHTDTQFLAANLAFCEIGISLCTIGPAIYHLYNIYFNIPEVMLQSTCFGQTVGQLLFMLLIPSFHAVLSADRFMGAIFPHIYKKRSRYYPLIVSCVVWIVSPSITASLYRNVSNSLMVVQCLGRYALSAGILYVYGEISISSLSIFLSVLLMIILQIQIRNTSINTGNVAEIGRRIRNQVTRCVALTALFNFLSYTGSLFISMAVSAYSNNPNTLVPYFNALYIFGGAFSFIVYFCCQKHFREGFYHLVKKCHVKHNNSVAVT